MLCHLLQKFIFLWIASEGTNSNLIFKIRWPKFFLILHFSPSSYRGPEFNANIKDTLCRCSFKNNNNKLIFFIFKILQSHNNWELKSIHSYIYSIVYSSLNVYPISTQKSIKFTSRCGIYLVFIFYFFEILIYYTYNFTDIYNQIAIRILFHDSSITQSKQHDNRH